MTSNDNRLGMGRSEQLWEMIDPQKTSTEVYQMLCDVPGDRIAHIISACAELDEFALNIVLRTAQDEAFTRDGRNHGEIGAILHLAAVMASVVSAFSSDSAIANEDGSVAYQVITNVYTCKSSLERYWHEGVEGFALHEANRAFFVKGWTFLTFTGVGEVIMDAELDRHLIWVGSRFDDLRPYALAIIDSGQFDKGTLEEFADLSLNPSDTHLADGSPNEQWYADNKERLSGYSKEGYYSIMPESLTKTLLARYDKNAVSVCGVPIRIEEFIYLEAQHNGSLEESSFMKVLGALCEGVDMEPPFAGKAALLFSNFSEHAVHAFGHMIEEYDLGVRSMLLKLILDHASLRKPVNAPFEDERFVGTVIAIAPVFKAFFEATYVSGETSSPDDEWSSVEWEHELEERREDAMWNAIHDCYDHIINVELDEAATSDMMMMIMFLRAMALAYFVKVDVDGTPDDKVVIDVALVNENLESICKNAKRIIHEQSLSFDTIARLPKS